MSINAVGATTAPIVTKQQNLADVNKDLTTAQADLNAITDDDIQLDLDGNQTLTQAEIEKMTAKELIAQRETIQANVDKLKSEAENIQQQLEVATNEINELNETYKKETAELEEKESDFDTKQNKLADLNGEITSTQNLEQKRYEGKISDITDSAINDYDPAKDGDDFDSYLSDKLNGVGITTYSALDSLNSDASKLASEVNSVLGDIKSQAKSVRNLASQITDKQSVIQKLQSQLDAKNTDITTQNTSLEAVNAQILKINGAGLTGAQVLSQISDAEKKLVTDNKIDLTEKFENGNPKYVFAKGQDDAFHIYQMDESGTSATSLARQFGTNGGGLRGSDIVPSGSGYMNGITDVAEDAGRAVYSFSCVNEDLTDGETCSSQKCYTTCSPLSFDIDGNGINTTSTTMQYDIDGDGKIDTVNNSAEWVLAFDKDKNGIAGENGSELFGDNTDLDGDGVKDGYANGFEALKALADKEGLGADGVLDVKNLKVLQEKYGLVMTKGYGGEAKSLSDLGIFEINLAKTNETKTKTNFDGRNNNLMTQEGATFTVNGKTQEYADIWNAKLNDLATTSPKENVVASSLSFDMKNIDLDSALGFLNKADKSIEGIADFKEVNYSDALIAAKSTAKAKESIEDEIEDKVEDVEEQISDEDFDEDFVDFQKKKNK